METPSVIESDAAKLQDAEPGNCQWQSPPDKCGYLPEETSSLIYRQLLTTSSEEYESLLQRGWRRHGVFFFRPACPTCRQCRSLRVCVADFRPSKSQRRCRRRNADLHVELSRPALSAQHVELFNRYHDDMHRRRDWPYREIDEAEYAGAFLAGRFDFAYELTFRRGGEMLGVSLLDMTPRVSSSVYFYHDPDWRPAGPGVFSLLTEIAMAAKMNLDHHYLGYWISACGSMSYKSRYRPHELLEDHVADNESPLWLLARPD